MSKDKRVEAELARLMNIYQNLPENTLEVMTPLIENAAFMKITMDDLQKEITKNGAVEIYQNGANQQGRKQSAAVQAYNQIIKNYNATIKLLSDKMPVVKVKEVFRGPFVVREKTEEERAAERAEEEARDERTRHEIEEASRRQKEQWKREGRPGYT